MAGESIRFGNVQGPVQTGDGTQYASGRDQNIAHGDQYVAGRDQTVQSGAGGAEVLVELTAIREALADLRLTSAERESLDADVAAMEDAAGGDEPDRGAIRTHLESITDTLRDAGAFAAAGAALIDPIMRVARWLGPLGATILTRL